MPSRMEKETPTMLELATSEPPPTQPAQPETKSSAHTHRPPLLSYDDIPEWYQDNPHIRTGYRPVSNSTRVSFHSWCYIHNESMNIYTHLIPSIAFLLGIWYILQYLHARYPNITPSDDGIFVFFLLTATTCLGLSTTYHTLLNHSPEVERIWLRMDFVGIVLLTVGDLVSGVYMVFWCETLQRKIYWAMISSLGAVTILILVTPWFQGPRWRIFRTMTFVATGLSGVAPIAHGICLFGWTGMARQSGLPYYLAEGGLLILGAVVYAVSRFLIRALEGDLLTVDRRGFPSP
jgi:adiponectin receptor